TSGTYFLVEDFLVEEEGVLLGAGGWTRRAPGQGGVSPHLGHIRHVVTDDRAVRRGVGRALMDHIFTNSRMAGMARLTCLSTLTAEPFYAAMGFHRVKPVTVPLGPGIDFPAVEMDLSL
ncbi:MAG: GNAT family N-acetyltransferase, partial [Pseudomonadota bacterium]